MTTTTTLFFALKNFFAFLASSTIGTYFAFQIGITLSLLAIIGIYTFLFIVFDVVQLEKHKISKEDNQFSNNGDNSIMRTLYL